MYLLKRDCFIPESCWWQEQWERGQPILISPLILPLSLSLSVSLPQLTLLLGSDGKCPFDLHFLPAFNLLRKGKITHRHDCMCVWVDACVISTLTVVSASVLCRQGWSPRSLQGSYRVGVMWERAKPLRLLTTVIPYWIDPSPFPSVFATEFQQKTKSTCLWLQLTRHFSLWFSRLLE